ncbi:MAG: IclR family transcriptional regulator [Sarcina sp.]
MSSNKKTINSVIKALNILECFSYDKKELKLTEIANLLDMPKSTTSNLIYTLESVGYIEHLEESGKFRLGSKLIKAGQICESNMGILDVARAYMKSLRDKYNENVQLAIPYYNNGMLECMSIEKIDGFNDINVSSQFGKLLPLHCTASGRLFLAFVDEEILKKTIENLNMDKRTEYTKVDVKDLMKEVEKIRKNKFSIVIEEGELGIISIAAPVFDYKNKIVGAISIVAPKARIVEKKDSIIKDLKNICNQVSFKLGYINQKS